MARWLKIVILVVILVALIVGGRFAFLRFLGGDSGESQVVQETEYVTVSRGTIMTTVNASGNIVYPEQVELAFSVTGDLREMVAAVGDAVEKDAPLAYLDDLELRDAVLREESNLRTAEINLEKAIGSPSVRGRTQVRACFGSSRVPGRSKHKKCERCFGRCGKDA